MGGAQLQVPLPTFSLTPPWPQQEERPIRQILYLGELLETCHFQSFWVILAQGGGHPKSRRSWGTPQLLLSGPPQDFNNTHTHPFCSKLWLRTWRCWMGSLASRTL